MTQPVALIVIGHPKLPRGPMLATCERCWQNFPCMQSTASLLSALGDRSPEVSCWQCAQPELTAPKPDDETMPRNPLLRRPKGWYQR